MYWVEDYPQIKGNFYLTARNVGASKKLKGKVGVITCMLKRYSGDFSEETKEQLYDTLHKASDWLECCAKEYGTDLQIENYYFTINIPADADPMQGYELIRHFIHTKTVDEAQEYYEKEMHYDEMPFLLVFDKNGRSFASHVMTGYRYVDEWSAIFKEDNGRFHWSTIVHELLHQFGAVDYYYPPIVKQCAERYFRDSIMGIGEYQLDDLTAYLVGIKETISADSYYFLEDTMWMNEELFAEAVKKAWE